MAEIPTVRIVNPSSPDEFIIVNEDDYDPAEHTLWGEGDDGGDADPLLDLTVSDLEDELPSVKDAERLEALMEAEDRTTAIDAIESRLSELEG